MTSTKLSPGDVIGFAGASFASDFINIGSLGLPRWGLSHVGIISHSYSDGLLLFESTTFNTRPCVITGKLFGGTQAQYPENSLSDSSCAAVWHYQPVQPLSRDETDTLTGYLMGSIGVPYDMIGAGRSGGKVFAAIEAFVHGENMAHIFCSEWVAAALREIGRFDTDIASKWSPNSLCRALTRRGVYQKPVRIK